MQLRDEAGTVFLVSHSLGVVRLTCNRALWLEKGQILMDGEANEVVDAYEQKYDPEVEKAERKARRAARRRKRLALEAAAQKAAEEARLAREAAEGAAAAGGAVLATTAAAPADDPVGGQIEDDDGRTAEVGVAEGQLLADDADDSENR